MLPSANDNGIWSKNVFFKTILEDWKFQRSTKIVKDLALILEDVVLDFTRIAQGFTGSSEILRATVWDPVVLWPFWFVWDLIM